MLTVESIHTLDFTQSSPNALDIPYVTADEAYTLLTVELTRFTKVLETLEADDWDRPTACTAWTVKDMLAHQAGGYASGTGYRELLRQYTARAGPGQLPEDAINALQVGERRDHSPAELIAELNRVGPVAIHKWAYGFRMARWATNLVKVPHPVAGTLSFQHLNWVIHSRDTWMHRLDICRAAGCSFEQTVKHDGRIAALVMLDVGRQLSPKLDGKAMVFDLTGVAGGKWAVGRGQTAAQVQMDVLEFNIFASGRFTYDEALAKAAISGDRALAEKALKGLLILY
jgi:uncharacterized protein (TIGR03083 family)